MLVLFSLCLLACAGCIEAIGDGSGRQNSGSTAGEIPSFSYENNK